MCRSILRRSSAGLKSFLYDVLSSREQHRLGKDVQLGTKGGQIEKENEKVRIDVEVDCTARLQCSREGLRRDWRGERGRKLARQSGPQTRRAPSSAARPASSPAPSHARTPPLSASLDISKLLPQVRQELVRVERGPADLVHLEAKIDDVPSLLLHVFLHVNHLV